MKKQLIGIVGLAFDIQYCNDGVAAVHPAQPNPVLLRIANRVSSSQTASQSSEEDDNVPSSNATELTVQFGDSGDSFCYAPGG